MRGHIPPPDSSRLQFFFSFNSFWKLTFQFLLNGIVLNNIFQILNNTSVIRRALTLGFDKVSNVNVTQFTLANHKFIDPLALLAFHKLPLNEV